MISSLQLRDFRSYRRLDRQWAPGTSLLIGGNGAGKTNVLEAIYLLAAGRSPRTPRDADLVRAGEPGFQITAAWTSASGGQRTVSLSFSQAHGRSWTLDGRGRPRGRTALGVVTAVFFSPDDLWLVKGGPAGRRSLLDRVLVQVSPLHAEALAAYDDALAQRNALLRDVRSRRAGRAQLEVWDEQLVEYGLEIARRRADLAADLGRRAAAIHAGLAAGERLRCVYVSGIDGGEGKRPDRDLAEAFRLALEAARPRELERGFTVVGPHRDEWSILVNEQPLRAFGSQGQQRTAVLAVKLAEREALAAETGTQPVLLLDDVLSELDGQRRSAMRRMLAGGGQAFLTSTDAEPGAGLDARRYRVGDGDVVAEA